MPYAKHSFNAKITVGELNTLNTVFERFTDNFYQKIDEINEQLTIEEAESFYKVSELFNHLYEELVYHSNKPEDFVIELSLNEQHVKGLNAIGKIFGLPLVKDDKTFHQYIQLMIPLSQLSHNSLRNISMERLLEEQMEK